MMPSPFRLFEEMMSWDPFRDVSYWPRERSFSPSFDLREDDENYVIEVDLPGVREDDLEITATENRLTIRGHRRAGESKDGQHYHVHERYAGEFVRTFRLPAAVDTEKIEARLQEGVLTLIAPKREASRARKIPLVKKFGERWFKKAA